MKSRKIGTRTEGSNPTSSISNEKDED